MPTCFWPVTLTTAVHPINRLPSTSINHETPYFRLHKTQPTFDHLHPFGSVFFVLLPAHERTKLTAQFAKYAFLGYGMKIAVAANRYETGATYRHSGAI